MSDFDASKFRQLMLKYYKKLEEYEFDNEVIKQLKSKEDFVIDFVVEYNSSPDNADKISENRILPVIPDIDKLDQYIRAIELIFTGFAKQRASLCKRPHEKCPYLENLSKFVGHKKIHLKFFNDIPNTPKEPYFIITNSPVYSPAEAAYLRQMVGSSKEEQDKFLTMFETFSLILFKDLKHQFEQNHRFAGLFILNSYLSENEDYKIILRISKDKNRLPTISHYKENKLVNDSDFRGYRAYGDDESNFAYRLIARI
jgi:hypothetical protein